MNYWGDLVNSPADTTINTATSVREPERLSPPGDKNGRLARNLTVGCTIVAALLPIKLSLTYIALIPLLLGWLYFDRGAIQRLAKNPRCSEIGSPLIFFLLIASISSIAGVSPLHSLPSLGSLLFFVLTIPLFALYADPRLTCMAMIAGQSLAAFHSLLESAVPKTLPKFFLGKVTESSQLSLTLILALGMALVTTTHKNMGNHQEGGNTTKEVCGGALQILIAALTTCALTLLGLHSEIGLGTFATGITALVALFCVARAYSSIKDKRPSLQLTNLLIPLQIPLLICALVVNLKRGPWLGVLVGCLFLCAIYARRLIVWIIVGASVVAFTVAPVRERLAQSYDHFTISGGRSTIWRIGMELASEYPLGIGYHNSGILRKFAPEIPTELKHFHNNLINIAAETGWIGLGIFIWLLITLIRVSIRNRYDHLYVAIGCAFISWQVAGTVEFNFGDSEVTIIVWALIGLLLQREIRGAESEDLKATR